MKTLRFLLSVCVATACALFAGCSKSGDHKPPSNVSGVTPEGRMEMQFKWVVGKEYVMRMDLSQTSETAVATMPQPFKQVMDMVQGYTISVSKELPDGGRELKLEFTGVKMNSKMGNGMALNFDSEQDPTSDAGNPVAPLLRRMVGGQLTYVVNAEGRVEKVEGVQELSARIMQGSPPQIQAAMSSMYSEGYFKQLCDVARMAPGRGVKPGNTWKLKIEEDMGTTGTVIVNLDLKFKDWEQHGSRKCALIDSAGSITSRPSEPAAGAAPPMSMQIDTGKVTGHAWFDPDLGMVVDSIIDQDMNIKMKMQNQAMTTHVKQRINFKLLDVVDASK